jgi:signal peptidase I
MSTLIIAASLCALIAGPFLLWAALLRIGLRWASVPNVRWRRVSLVTLIVCTVRVVIAAFYYLYCPTDPELAKYVTVATLVSMIAGDLIAIMLICKVTLRGAFKSWIPTLLQPVVTVPFVSLVVNPFLMQSYSIPTNSMAPTLLGTHWQLTCSKCGSPAYCSPPGEYEYENPDDSPMICRDHFHVTQRSGTSDRIHAGDRLIAAKFLRPRRWDLIVFRFPEDPSLTYVKRLVGLPGEKITIRDGEIWADDQLLTRPAFIRELVYESKDLHINQPLWGSIKRPAKLAHDEYFVLGDFPPRSADARFWIHGVPGHNPYAVPTADVYGVVTHIYWPPSRWRIFR